MTHVFSTLYVSLLYSALHVRILIVCGNCVTRIQCFRHARPRCNNVQQNSYRVSKQEKYRFKKRDTNTQSWQTLLIRENFWCSDKQSLFFEPPFQRLIAGNYVFAQSHANDDRGKNIFTLVNHRCLELINRLTDEQVFQSSIKEAIKKWRFVMRELFQQREIVWTNYLVEIHLNFFSLQEPLWNVGSALRTWARNAATRWTIPTTTNFSTREIAKVPAPRTLILRRKWSAAKSYNEVNIQTS